MNEKIPAPGADGDDVELRILEVAFNESVRKLPLPIGAVDTLQSRAQAITATATAVAAFLGGLGFRAGLSRWEWAIATAGGVPYVISLGVCLSVLTPRIAGWEVGQDSRKLATAARNIGDLKTVYRELAIRYQEGFENNERRARKLARRLKLAAYLVPVELGFLLWLVVATAT